MADRSDPEFTVSILLVDDHAENLMALEAVLAPLNQRLVTARSGEEALRHVLDENFAVILLDVNMPGMSGFETASLIRSRAQTSTTPIIFLTAYSRTEMQTVAGYESGGVDFLSKPFDPVILRAKVAVFVAMERQKREAAHQAELLRRSMLTIIEERKRTNEERQRRAELEEFAHIASHDLREPLRAMNAFAQLLGLRYTDILPTEAREYLGYITEGATRISRLVENLVEYANVNTDDVPLEQVDLNKVLDEVLGIIARVVTSSGAVIHPVVLPTVVANDFQISKVFEHLILNAIKFRRDAIPEISIKVTGSDDKWLFEFKDNGIGFDQQFADRIFILFKRLHVRDKYEGVGFGLAMCKRIIERHHGRIWAQSEPGRGTTVFFTLPREIAGSGIVAERG